jgi:hypothetical protein
MQKRNWEKRIGNLLKEKCSRRIRSIFKKRTKTNFKKLPVKLPNRALTNIDLAQYAKKLKILYFRGVFMRDTLPKNPKKK